MTDTRWWPVSRGPLCLSHKARCSASVLLCHSFRTGWSHHIWPPRCLSLVPLPRPAGHSQVLFASGETERGRKKRRISRKTSVPVHQKKKKDSFNSSEIHHFQKIGMSWIYHVQGLHSEFGLTYQAMTPHLLHKPGRNTLHSNAKEKEFWFMFTVSSAVLIFCWLPGGR